MNTLNLDRLAATLSDILSSKYSKQILVTLEGEDDNNNPDRPGSDSFGNTRLHHVCDAV